MVSNASTPPENVAVTEPLLAPVHVASVLASDRDGAGGAPTVMDLVVVHELASLSVTVCEPAVWPENVWGEVKVVKPPPSMSTCSVPVPPENVAVMVPLPPPLQVRSVLVSDSESAGGLTRVTDWLVVHRLPSRSVTVWDPTATPV